jgi:hypothetical protein
MSYPQAVLGGLALIAAAIVFTASSEPRASEGGAYEGVMSSRQVPSMDLLWRVNKQTGAVSICYGPSTREAPTCSPWSK